MNEDKKVYTPPPPAHVMGSDIKAVGDPTAWLFHSPPEGRHHIERGTTSYIAAEATFVEYFVRNYPGPDTVIHNPNWHAPKIFAAAASAIRAALSAPEAEG